MSPKPPKKPAPANPPPPDPATAGAPPKVDTPPLMAALDQQQEARDPAAALPYRLSVADFIDVTWVDDSGVRLGSLSLDRRKVVGYGVDRFKHHFLMLSDRSQYFVDESMTELELLLFGRVRNYPAN